MGYAEMRAYATYINAGVRGSRFMGDCEVSAPESIVQLTGRRMPKAQVWVRAFCYVIFVPWALMLLGVIAMVAARENGWPIFVMIEAAGFLVIAIGLGAGDIWAAKRGPMETVQWRPALATTPKRTLDGTVSATGVADTLAYRYAKGKCVVRLRAPIGPGGRLRLLALRTELYEQETLARVLSGAEDHLGVVAAPVSPPNVVHKGGHLPGEPDRFCRKCGAAVTGGAFCGKCGSALLRYGSAQDG